MSTPVRIGLLGIGQRGLQHLDALWKLQDEGAVKVVALADTFAENLQEEKIQQYVEGFCRGDIGTYTEFDAMLADREMDALYVSLPPSVHRREVVRAAEAGLHLFVEKPMSLYMDEAVEMERAIVGNKVLSAVGFQMRYDTWNDAVRAFLSGRRMAMITNVSNGALESHSVKHTATETVGGPANRVWAASYEWSGSSVVESGIHQMDLMRYWCGDIEWVQAHYVHRDPDDIEDGGDNPYAYSVTFGFEGGGIANLLVTKLRKTYYGDGYQDIAWDRGHLKIEAEGPVAYYYEGPYPPAERPTADALRHPLPVPSRNNSTEAINRAFVDAIRSGDSTKIRSTFSESMNSLAAVLAANASDALGGERIDVKMFLTDPKYAEFRRKKSATGD